MRVCGFVSVCVCCTYRSVRICTFARIFTYLCLCVRIGVAVCIFVYLDVIIKMCDESEPSIEGRPISEMKVVELKEELGKRGLSKIGNKNALYERLKEYLLTEINAKCESEVQSTAIESPQRDLVS
ncbi:unnamed protein product [Onchocerca flexuosa]|uniref:SAP domain-containing protein n=1 Tax=Onchocerca flexuosa TaxID=387005 RepID=A0A183HSN8_9BILA|nr:unnamed protein product [Onchocerca flexuosa]